MRPLLLTVIRPALAALAVAIATAPAPLRSAQPPEQRSGEPGDRSRMPVVPPGALRVIEVTWHKGRAAICAEEPGSAPGRSGRPLPRTRVWVPRRDGESPPPDRRPFPRTRVWVQDGTGTRQVALGPGACDPAWSPDGDRLAVVTPEGLWILSADLRRTTHLVDLRHGDGAPSGFESRALSGPRWAPDASAIAFVVSNGRTAWVEVADARTGARRYVSDPETYEFAWEADSRSLRLGSRVVRLD